MTESDWLTFCQTFPSVLLTAHSNHFPDSFPEMWLLHCHFVMLTYFLYTNLCPYSPFYLFQSTESECWKLLISLVESTLLRSFAGL